MNLKENWSQASHEFFKSQALVLLESLGIKLNQVKRKEDPLRFLHVAQDPWKTQQHLLLEDEQHFATQIIEYVNEDNHKRSRSPASLSRELVECMGKSEMSPTYLIFGTAGTGKSFYLATLFEFIKHRLHSQQLGSKHPHFPIIFSNIKHSRSLSMKYRSTKFSSKVVLDGIPLSELFPTINFSTPQDLADEMLIGQSTLKKGIILIDSLDEYISSATLTSNKNPEDGEKTGWQHLNDEITLVNQEFQEAGFIPIWTCREREVRKVDLLNHFGRIESLQISQIPKLKTDNLAKVCNLESLENTPNHKVFNLITKTADLSNIDSSLSEMDKEFLQWLGKTTEQNPLFFHFRMFASNERSNDSRLTISERILVEMYEFFMKAWSRATIFDGDDLFALRSNAVISDIIVKSLFIHLYENQDYEKELKLSKHTSNFIKQYQQALSDDVVKNPEDFTEIFSQCFEQSGHGTDVGHVFRLLDHYGFFQTLQRDFGPIRKFRHRSFAEFFGISFSDIRGVSPEILQQRKIIANSVWAWRNSDAFSAHDTVRDADFKAEHLRTAGFLLRLPEHKLPPSLRASMEKIDKASDEHLKTDAIRGGDFKDENGNHIFSKEQVKALKYGIRSKQPIILRGWPGTGKTFTGTHFLLARLVNLFNRSDREVYVAANEPKGLVVTLNPKLSEYLKSERELNKYEHGPWKKINIFQIGWKELSQSIDIMSMREIIVRLEGIDASQKFELIDLKGVYDRYWRTYERNRYPVEYTWRMASEDFQKRFHDIISGSFISDYDRVQPNPEISSDDVKRAEGREKWWDLIKSQLYSKNKSILTVQEACTKLIHRFTQTFYLFGDPNQFVSTALFPTDERDNIQRCDDLRNNPWTERFSVSLVDEVQDLPVSACVLIALLTTRYASKDHLMLAGDENQVINQSKFSWADFNNDHEHLVSSIRQQYGGVKGNSKNGELDHKSYFHTVNLWTSVDNFVENRRNYPLIVNTWKRAGSWLPSDEVRVDDIEGIEDCTSEVPVDTVIDAESVSIVYLKKGNYQPLDRLRAMDTIVQFVGSRSGISIVSMSPYIDGYRNKHENVFESTELYTPNTIKGLERDVVFLFGTLAFEPNKPNAVGWSPSAVTEERMRLIVGMSRGKKHLVIFTPTERLDRQDRITFGQGIPSVFQFPLTHFQIKEDCVLEWDINEIDKNLNDLIPEVHNRSTFTALDELLQAIDYESDQLDKTIMRVRKIILRDLSRHKVKESEKTLLTLFGQYLELAFEHVKLDVVPTSFEILLFRPRIRPKKNEGDDGAEFDIVEYLLEYNKIREPTDRVGRALKLFTTYYKENYEKPLNILAKRHRIFKEYTVVIDFLRKSSFRQSADVNFIHEFNEVESVAYRVQESMKSDLVKVLHHMDFKKYPWDDSVKGDPDLALLLYLAVDFEKVRNACESSAEPNTLTQPFVTLVKHLSAIEQSSYEKFQDFVREDDRIRNRDLGFAIDGILHTLHRADELRLEHNWSDEKANEVEFCWGQVREFLRIQGKDLLSKLPQTSMIILIKKTMSILKQIEVQFKLDNPSVDEHSTRILDASLQTGLKSFVNVYFDGERWVDGELKSQFESPTRGVEHISLKEFKTIYKLLGPQYVATLKLESLPFSYYQHDLTGKWINQQNPNLFEKYTSSFSANVRRLTSKKSFTNMNKENFVWASDGIEDSSRQTRADVIEFLTTVGNTVDRDDFWKFYQNNYSEILEDMLLLQSEYFIRGIAFRNNPLDGPFRKLLTKLHAQRYVQFDRLLENILGKIELIDQQHGSRIHDQNMMILRWTSILYLISPEREINRDSEEQFHLKLSDEIVLRMQYLSHRYPALNLPEEFQFDWYICNRWSELECIQDLPTDWYHPVRTGGHFTSINLSEALMEVLNTITKSSKFMNSDNPKTKKIYLLEPTRFKDKNFNYRPSISLKDLVEKLAYLDSVAVLRMDNNYESCSKSTLVSVIFTRENFHEKIQQFVVDVLTRILHATNPKAAANRSSFSISTLASEMRRLVRYKDHFDKNNHPTRTIPWAIDLNQRLKEVKAMKRTKQKWNKVFKRLVDEYGLGTGKDSKVDVKQKQFIEEMAWKELDDELVEDLVRDCWIEELTYVMKEMLHLNIDGSGDTAMFSVNNNTQINTIRDKFIG